MTYDIILTTYDTVVGDESTGPNDSGDEARILHACEWHRVVLDEGEQGEREEVSLETLSLSHRSQPTLSATLRQSDIVLCRLLKLVTVGV